MFSLKLKSHLIRLMIYRSYLNFLATFFSKKVSARSCFTSSSVRDRRITIHLCKRIQILEQFWLHIFHNLLSTDSQQVTDQMSQVSCRWIPHDYLDSLRLNDAKTCHMIYCTLKMQIEIIQSLYILKMFCPTPQGVSGSKAKHNAGNIQENGLHRKYNFNSTSLIDK